MSRPERPEVITRLLSVDDTGVVAHYIRQLEAEMEEWRELLVEADSMLSAAGYGRAVTKAEMIELSSRIRKAYTA